ncbi:outer membrane protein [Pseudoalteromonas sp. G4]|uniref:outer membrane protein n=1 Tax=Pseudoalteromonas sp. G4 TaxID=2992761 RepID=UPI00237E36CF|nr:outer membrane beta-barrel protein [Pseudoalteromonas sp. G4]MDE3272816.1 outer membrane beta-barrel protein [Pseudoalteromonas sp. G4]
MKPVSSLVLFLALLLPISTLANNQNQGQYFIKFGLASNYYNYNSKDARDELDQNFQDLLDEYDLNGDDADIVNASVGLGYYVTNDFAVRGNYTYGIELDWLDFCFFDCENNVYHDSDASILTLDGIYHFYSVNDKLSFYGLAGLAVTHVSTKLSYWKDNQREVITRENSTNYGANLGLGVQYDFAKNWGLKAGYSHHTFLSMDKYYLNMEYRF